MLHNKSWFRSTLVIALALIGAPCVRTDCRAQASDPLTVYYNTNNGIDAEKTFTYQVLKLALSKSGKPYVLRPSTLPKATEQRAIEAIANGERVDVAWLGATQTADNKLWPVRIPIERGLLGYRLMLIDRSRQAQFDQVRSLSDLRKFYALQGGGWPDVDILRNAGIKVLTGDYRNLFKMLSRGRGDFLPVAVYEAFDAQADHTADAPNLEVEETLVLHYRFTSMYYVRKSNKTLHDDIYNGLLAAYRDGSYQALFNSNAAIQSGLKLGDLKHRRVIEIDNPFLSPESQAIDAKFWFKP